MDITLEGANVLITGAGRGVGRTIAHALAEHGASTIFVNDVDSDRAASVADEVTALGAKGIPAVTDVTDRAAVQGMVDATYAHGGVDVLVNNAGNMGTDRLPEYGRFWQQGPDTWMPFVQVNLFGPINCTHAVLPQMIDRESTGRIITIVSDAGRIGEAGLEVYSAAKAGAAGFTRSIARAVGRYGITANNVSLSATRTPGVADQVADEQTVDRLLTRYAIRRLGEPDDAAAVVLLLASSAASWITGQTYAVNGGYAITP